MKKRDIQRTPESQIVPEHGWRERKPQLRSLNMPIFSSPKRVLVVVAHPDDADFTCGGLLQRLNDEGCNIVVYCATSGQKGRSVKSHPNLEDFIIAGVVRLRPLGRRYTTPLHGLPKKVLKKYAIQRYSKLSMADIVSVTFTECNTKTK